MYRTPEAILGVLMATWDDEVRERFNAVAGMMIAIADALDALINLSDADTDLTLLVNSRDWLRDRSCVFSPPGEPEEGYPTNGADVINLEAYRAWKQIRQA